MNKYYVIRSIHHAGLAWSNEFGWVANDTYDVFSQTERDTLNLPIDGQWWTLGE